jgi:hypothetical protein
MIKDALRKLTTALLASSVLAVSGVAELCKADDAQDAVDLLTYALKCAIKPFTYEVNGYVTSSLTIRKFKGDAHQLVIEEEITWDNGTVLNHTEKANFAEIDDKSIEIRPRSDSRAANVFYGCTNNRTCVISAAIGFPMNTGMIEVCDLATAKHTKLAIETLIRLNKSVPVEAISPATETLLILNKTNNTIETLIRPNKPVPTEAISRTKETPSVSSKTKEESAADDGLFGDLQDLKGPRSKK